MTFNSLIGQVIYNGCDDRLHVSAFLLFGSIDKLWNFATSVTTPDVRAGYISAGHWAGVFAPLKQRI
ncbi:hypothetical protein [Algoriphagus antarcticus]|uniref:hypothetical protein n=1 Tax=Algoriphagus antarcticus TaxID=238540 RepID=UPI001475A175|nr:hypothetical protein [Algoriphagus antarcticus]